MIRTLSIQELKEIYETYMVNDFPENELKSYNMLKDAILNKECVAIGYFENGELKGYSTIIIADRILLLDYFAILPSFRKQGLGTVFLEELSKYLITYDALLIESEVPDHPTAIKRVAFYHKCGCKDSGIKAKLYFVDYVLLYKELSRTFTPEEIEADIHKTYHIVYPHFENTKYLSLYKYPFHNQPYDQ